MGVQLTWSSNSLASRALLTMRMGQGPSHIMTAPPYFFDNVKSSWSEFLKIFDKEIRFPNTGHGSGPGGYEGNKVLRG